MNPRNDEPDDYLWTAAGPPDPEIAKLERALAPAAWRPRPFAPPPRARSRSVWFAIAAAAALAAAGAWFWRPAPQQDHVRLVADGERAVGTSEWLHAKAMTRLELERGSDDIAWFTLHEGSRMQVQRLAEDETRFYLEIGKLEAFVTLHARPRFFQVDTPSTRCVDLGCKYTLDVDANGDAFVHVTSGRVAFANGDREVFVPREAMCRALKGAGAGLPRYEDAPAALVAAVQAFDTLPADSAAAVRFQRAQALCQVAKHARDTLPVWHLLWETDEKIVAIAEATLGAIAEVPEVLQTKAPPESVAVRREAWKEHLYARCWF